MLNYLIPFFLSRVFSRISRLQQSNIIQQREPKPPSSLSFKPHTPDSPAWIIGICPAAVDIIRALVYCYSFARTYKNINPNPEAVMAKKGENKTRKSSTSEIITSISAALVLGWLVLGTQANQTSAQQSNFQGGAPEIRQAEEVRTIRILFPAGVRSSWHTHSWGQLLMIEEGRGLTQDRGGPLLEMHPGEPWWTPAGREHWHGAHPDEDALQLTIYEGTVDWLDPVTDTVYNAARQRP